MRTFHVSYWKFQAKLKETIEAALLFQPHVIVTVDNKGFSFRLLKNLRGNINCCFGAIVTFSWWLSDKYGVGNWGNDFAARYNQLSLDSPVHFHYVAPSFWAWKGGEARLKGLTEFVDHILCILPIEEEICRARGLDATFVGHPIVEDVLELNSVGHLLLFFGLNITDSFLLEIMPSDFSDIYFSFWLYKTIVSAEEKIITP